MSQTRQRRGTPQPQQRSQHEEQPSSSDSRPTSPISQILYSRVEEKKNLQSLNDRLANYIDTVRTLQSENDILRQTIEKTETTVQTETSTVRNLYEKQLSDARKALDKINQDKSQLELEVKKERASREELTARQARLLKDITSLEGRMVGAENEARNARTELQEEVAKRKKLEAEKKETAKEADELRRQLADNKKELDQSLLAKTEAVTRLKSLQESLAFEKQVIQDQLNRSQTQMTEVRQHIERQYEERLEQRLADELTELRAENDEKLRQCRADLTNRFENQAIQLKQQLDQKKGAESSLRAEINVLNGKCSNWESQVKKAEAISSNLKERIIDLEKQLEQERSWHLQGLTEKEKEIADLYEKIKINQQEYQDLYDVKIALDLEIDTYRKLLEGEETRLDSSRPGSRVSPYSSRPGSRVAKRKTGSSMGGLFEEHRTKFISDVNTSGLVGISDTDPERSRFVKLHNPSNEDISLNGWQLQRVIGDEVVTTYKFHRNIVIKSGDAITVWGSTAEGRQHAPPAELTMKTQSWTSAPEMKTVLLDGQGAESSVCNNTVRKTVSSSPFKRLRTSLGVGDTGEGNDQGQQCCVM